MAFPNQTVSQMITRNPTKIAADTMATLTYPPLVGLRNGYGYQPSIAPRMTVKPVQISG